MLSIFRNRFDLDEITFENRNKEYGAYQLRKRYNLNVAVSIVIGSVLLSSMIIYPFLKTLTKKHDVTPIREFRMVAVKMDRIQPPKDIFVPPPPPPPPSKITPPNVRYVAPVVVDSVPPLEKALPSVAQVLASNPSKDNEVVGSTGSGINDDLLSGQKGDNTDEPFMIVEVPPTFKGGSVEDFRDWVGKRTVYPAAAQDNGIQGKVYVSFIVERDGSISNVKVVKGIDKLLDDEAIRAIESSPKWTPGLQRGRPVRVRFVINLIFTLTK